MSASGAISRSAVHGATSSGADWPPGDAPVQEQTPSLPSPSQSRGGGDRESETSSAKEEKTPSPSQSRGGGDRESAASSVKEEETLSLPSPVQSDGRESPGSAPSSAKEEETRGSTGANAARPASATGAFRRARGLVGATALSRLLGFVREMLMAIALGTGATADAFFLAWLLPNLARRVLGEGALASALMPPFIEARERGEPAEATRLLATAFTRVAIGLALLVVVLEVALGLLRSDAGQALAVTAGLAAPLARADVAIELTQVLLPYMLFVCLTGLLGGALNALGAFAVQARAPIVLNAAWIGVLAVGSGLLEAPLSRARALAATLVVLGGLELLVHVRALRALGVDLRPTLAADPARWARVRALFLSLVLGAVVFQVNVALDSLIAWVYVPEGGLSALSYANRLVQLPIGVLGVALSTALFPELLRRAKQGDLAGLGQVVDQGARAGLFVALPAALGLVALAAPLVTALFERGAFDAESTARTARALTLLAPAVVAACVSPLVTRVFHAEEDARLPVRASIAGVGLNLVLNLVLVRPLGEAGLALASSISQTAVLAGLLVALDRRRRARGETPDHRALAGAFVRCGALALAMGAAALLVHALVPGPSLLRIVAGVAAGAAVYGGGALLLRFPEARVLFSRKVA